MIPLRDASRAPVRFPIVTVSLIVVNVLAFVWEAGSDEAAIIRWAVVPAELLRGQGWITPSNLSCVTREQMHHRQLSGATRGERPYQQSGP
jgi:hypothetical protein